VALSADPGGWRGPEGSDRSAPSYERRGAHGARLDRGRPLGGGLGWDASVMASPRHLVLTAAADPTTSLYLLGGTIGFSRDTTGGPDDGQECSTRGAPAVALIRSARHPFCCLIGCPCCRDSGRDLQLAVPSELPCRITPEAPGRLRWTVAGAGDRASWPPRSLITPRPHYIRRSALQVSAQASSVPDVIHQLPHALTFRLNARRAENGGRTTWGDSYFRTYPNRGALPGPGTSDRRRTSPPGAESLVLCGV
jgi:hypothetical protein